MSDEDRKQWVQNDERLYSWWLSSKKGLGVFVRENRVEITKAIEEASKPKVKTWRDYV